jgi:glycerol-3-phosphate dehydrogenase (NAD(P)+)
MKVLVIGAGAWGTAVAVSASARHDVTLWARSAAQVAAMQATRENKAYLPGIALTPRLALSAATDVANVASQHDLIVVATPMSALRANLQLLANQTAPVVWLCKGFEQPQGSTGAESVGLLGHEVMQSVAPHLRAGVLSGPSFAQEVARNKPTALVAASPHEAVTQALVEAFHSEHVRVYANADWAGVEVGGAVKNVLAIATGLCDGLALGLNARAALITRGLREMSRLGVALGGQTETFMGLSGLGDLVLTATGDLSRNRQVGLGLAQGMRLDTVLAKLGHVAEGVYSARTVVARAQALDVDMPIASAVMALLDGTLTPHGALAQLMQREPTAER